MYRNMFKEAMCFGWLVTAVVVFVFGAVYGFADHMITGALMVVGFNVGTIWAGVTGIKN